MNPDPLENDLREKAWRRPLTVAEQAQLETWLASHPEARSEWTADVALSAALARLPERPVPSNLAARVLAEIDRKDLATAGARRTNWFGWMGSVGWVPRTAVVVIALAAGLIAYHQRQQAAQTRAVSTLANAAWSLPTPGVLQDMEVIRRLNLTPAADVELLALDLK
jgi:anti-sigma factor RsiW